MPACVCRPLVGCRVHEGNASGDTAVILREAGVVDGRSGARLDYGELHHYLAWVHLRVGRRRAALPHLAQAAMRGQLPAVIRTLFRGHGSSPCRWWPATRRTTGSPHADWLAEAEAWVAPLREHANLSMSFRADFVLALRRACHAAWRGGCADTRSDGR